MGNCRDALNLDELGRDMLSIALPALLALAADPITSLVDTAFVGHLGTHIFSFTLICLLLKLNNLSLFSH